MILWVERRFPATKEFHGATLVVTQSGKRLITPMLIVMLALGTTDLLFALDSIPAIYGSRASRTWSSPPTSSP